MDNLLGPSLKAGLPLIRNVPKPLAKSVLIPLAIPISIPLTAAASATDATIHKKIFALGRSSDLALRTATLIISSEEMNDIMKIVKLLEESDLLKKGVSRTSKNKAKEQKGGFLSMLLGTLGASLLGNLLAGKGAIAASQGRGTMLEWVRIYNATSSFHKF